MSANRPFDSAASIRPRVGHQPMTRRRTTQYLRHFDCLSLRFTT